MAAPTSVAVTEPTGEGMASLATLSMSLVPIKAITIPTYDGSGQAVHPDVVYIPEGWNGWEYWMAFTPYAKASLALENPSIVVSHDGITWSVPAGLTNPLVPHPASGYNSDPDLHLDQASGELVLIFREVSGGRNLIKSMRSPDGVHWSAPRLVFRRLNHGMVSPSITTLPGALPVVWYVQAGSGPCVQRITRVFAQQAQNASALDPVVPEQGWAVPRRLQLEQPTFYIWHLDVIWVAERHEYWAIYPAYRRRMCGEHSLFFARSPDGVNWTTYRVPFLRPRDVAWMNQTVYRASMVYDAHRDAIRFWISAAAGGSNWGISYVEYNFTTFLHALENGAAESPSSISPAAILFGNAGALRDDGP